MFAVAHTATLGEPFVIGAYLPVRIRSTDLALQKIYVLTTDRRGRRRHKQRPRVFTMLLMAVNMCTALLRPFPRYVPTKVHSKMNACRLSKQNQMLLLFC